MHVTRSSKILVEWKPIYENIVAYRLTEVRESQGEIIYSDERKLEEGPNGYAQKVVTEKGQTKRVVEGLTYEDAIIEFGLDPNAGGFTRPSHKLGKYDCFYQMMKPGFREALRTYGWSYYNMREALGLDENEEPYKDLEVENPFSYEGEYEIVSACFSHEIYLDAGGRVLPRATVLESITHKMNSKLYDLRKAIDILRDREDVLLLPRNRACFRPDGYEEYITDHWYNGYHGIDVLWQPEDEDWDRYVAGLTGDDGVFHGGTFTRGQHLFNLDVFGLRSGGACLRETFYDTDDGDLSDEDDDY
jgi:hypothetical protein